MPLPDYPLILTSAPRWAGVGLRAQLRWERQTRPPRSWPEDWWQRNYDLFYEAHTIGGWIPMSPRSFRIPGFPYPASLEES